MRKHEPKFYYPMNPYQTTLIVILIAIIVVGGFFYFYRDNQVVTTPPPSPSTPPPAPPQTGKEDLIVVDAPKPGSKITSPLTISGEARGNWYFEASFPIELLDANGTRIPTEPGFIQAQGDWMTSEFVPFSSTITFPAQAAGSVGTLILHKDNPSGLPEHDDELRVPITF